VVPVRTQDLVTPSLVCMNDSSADSVGLAPAGWTGATCGIAHRASGTVVQKGAV